MNVFAKRYFVWISLIFLGFSWISIKNNSWKIFIIFAALEVAFYFLFTIFRKIFKNHAVIIILVLLASLIGFSNGRLLLHANEKKIEKYSGEHIISGYIVDMTSKSGFVSEHVAVIESIDGERVNLRAPLVTEFQSELYRGDFFECRAEISSLEEYEDAKYLRNSDSYEFPLVCVVETGTEIEFLEKEFRLETVLADLNMKLSATLRAFLGRDSGSLASALILGNRELLDDSVLRDFKRAGVYHMLALSGLHVAILIGALEFLLKKARVPSKIRITVLALISLFYVALTGFQLSACRSMIMLWTMYLSFVWGKKRDALTSLFIAISIIVLISPSAIIDVGLQLSFLSTLGVIASSMIVKKIPFLNREYKENTAKKRMWGLFKKLLSTLIASLCVFVATLPTVASYFGEVSLATFVSNIFMGVLCEIFMMLALVVLVLSNILALASPLAFLTKLIGFAMLGAVEALADVEGIMLSLNYPFINLLSAILFAASIVLFGIKLKRKWLLALPSVVLAVLLVVSTVGYKASREGFVRAEYCTGDTLIISSADGVYLCDASEGRYNDLLSSIAIANENCFTEIDGIILSHYHTDHLRTLKRISECFKLHSLYLPMPQTEREGEVMSAIVRELESEGVEIYIYNAEEPLEILSGELVVSNRAFTAGYVHPSVALSFSYGESRLSLIGRPYFGTYLEQSGAFEEYITESDYLIFGSDGRDFPEKISFFHLVKNGAEVSFPDFATMQKFDFEPYLDDCKIYFNVQYKKYDLK